MASAHDISTKMSGLATLLHLHNIHCDTKFTSLYTQLDQIQRVVQKPYPRSKLNRKTEQNQSRTKKFKSSNLACSKHKGNYKTNLGKHINIKQDEENKIKTIKEKGSKNEYLKAKKLLGFDFLPFPSVKSITINKYMIRNFKLEGLGSERVPIK